MYTVYFYALDFCSVVITLQKMNDTTSYTRWRYFEKQVRLNLGETENFRVKIPLQKMPRLNTACPVLVQLILCSQWYFSSENIFSSSSEPKNG